MQTSGPPTREEGSRPSGRAGPALTALVLAAAGCGNPAGPSAAALAVAPPRLAFPRIPFGSSATAVYRLENRSPAPLRLTRLGPAPCDCAGLELTLDPEGAARRIRIDREGVPEGLAVELSPGTRATLALTLDTSRYREPRSRLIGGFAVIGEGFAPVLLEYAADVYTPFVVEPWAVELGRVGIRERASGLVGIRPHDERNFTPIVPGEVDGWTLDLQTFREGATRSFRIVLTAPPELPQGPFQKEFSLQTDLAGAPPIRFSVQGEAVPDLGVSPERIILRPVAPGGTAAEARVSSRAPGASFEIQGVEIDGPPDARLRLAAATRPARPGPGFVLRLSWEGPPPAAAVDGTLRIRTSDQETPELLLSWTVLAR